MVFSEKFMDFPYFSGSIITVFLKTMIHFSEFCAFFGVPKKKSDVVDSKDIISNRACFEEKSPGVFICNQGFLVKAV